MKIQHIGNVGKLEYYGHKLNERIAESTAYAYIHMYACHIPFKLLAIQYSTCQLSYKNGHYVNAEQLYYSMLLAKQNTYSMFNCLSSMSSPLSCSIYSKNIYDTHKVYLRLRTWKV